MSRNMLNWFLCGVTTGSALTALAASVVYAALVYGDSVSVVPAFATALSVGALCYTLRRDRHPRAAGAPFISRERKARLPRTPPRGMPIRHGPRATF